MKISYGGGAAVAAGRGFAFMADPINWPLFVPSVRAVDKCHGTSSRNVPDPPRGAR